MATKNLVQPYSSTTTTTKLARVVEKTDLETGESKWVGLKKIDWIDQDGKDRKWESAERKTRSEGGVDAVSIFTILEYQDTSKSLDTIIILQYRPPLDAICVEFPAGLIDKGESAEQAAIRELREETGYISTEVLNVGETIGADPGMSNANMKIVTLKVKIKDENSVPKPHLEEGEHIEKRIVSLSDLYTILQGYEKLGYIVDARLSHFAWGIQITKTFLK